MKLLIIILFLIPSCCFAGNWIAKSNLKSSAPDAGPITTKSKCELTHSDICFDKTGKDMRRYKAGFVDDLNDPNFRPVEDSPVKIDCNDFDDCSSRALDPVNVCDADASGPKWDDFANWPGVTGVTGPWFIWCQKTDGTFKQLDALVADTAGSTQADTDDAQLASDNALRATKAGERATGADACVIAVNAGGVLANPDIQNCINVLVKQLFENRIAPADL